MGTFAKLFAHALKAPLVRDTAGRDWRKTVADVKKRLPPEPTLVMVAEKNPLRFAAAAATSLAGGHRVSLANPLWSAAEFRAAIAIAQPQVIFGKRIRLKKISASATRIAPHLHIPTGGTTGTLRFATHSARTLLAAAAATREFFELTRFNTLCLLPLHHISGFQQLIRAVAAKTPLTLGDWPTISKGTLPSLSDDAPWITSLVPTQLSRLLENPRSAKYLRNFSLILVGGASCPTQLIEKARAHRLRLAFAYGATETAAVFAAQKPSAFLAGKNTSLELLPKTSVRILDTNTLAPLPIGKPGLIELTAPSLFLGYFPKRRTRRTFVLGDIGSLTGDTHLLLHGRADTAINTGGEKVFPEEIESAIRASTAIREVAVVGLADKDWGQAVAAVFPLKEYFDIKKLCRALRKTLAPHKIPKHFLQIDWPATEGGKPPRTKIQALAQAKLADFQNRC